MPRSTKKVDAFDEGRPVMPLQQDVEEARQSAKRADADRAGTTQTRTTVVPHDDRLAVAVAIRLQGPQDGATEEVNLPNDNRHHQGQTTRHGTSTERESG